MRYRIETQIRDGLAEAPGFEVDVDNAETLADLIDSELTNDAGERFAPAKLVVERINA
jgi:hypothetical protein